jgi:hypothetical protein
VWAQLVAHSALPLLLFDNSARPVSLDCLYRGVLPPGGTRDKQPCGWLVIQGLLVGIAQQPARRRGSLFGSYARQELLPAGVRWWPEAKVVTWCRV